jgi:hypothetical protein
MAKKTTATAEAKRTKKQQLIPVVSDLVELSRCAARTLCELARRKPSNLGEMTLAELRTVLEREFVELEQALEQIDLLIEEQGGDSKAIRLDLEPAGLFAKIREKCLPCH